MKINKIALFIVIFILALAALYLTLDRAAINLLSAKYGLTVSYKGLENNLYRQFHFTGLNVVDNKRGIGLSSQSALIKPDIAAVLSFKPSIEFKLNGVNFIRKGSHRTGSYDTLDGLIAVPFMSSWQYKEMSGLVEISPDKAHVKNFTATGDEIRVSFAGDLFYNKKVKGEITVGFAEKILRKIPPEMANVVLRDDGNGWKSLTVNLNGDFNAPAIQVTGKLFRLTIRNAE